MVEAEREAPGGRGNPMTESLPKLVLSSSRDIPFSQLVLSQKNVRRVKAGLSIEDLADDIYRRTLLQSLNVRAIVDADGQETGQFEVPAGGRRFRALELLVKTKRMAKDQPVPCVVREAASPREDRSLRMSCASLFIRSTSSARSAR